MFKIFHNLENSRTSLIWFMLSFLVFVSIRNFLEIFSDKAVFSDFNNYFLFYISLLLSSVILFRLFTNESIVKLLKILLTFYAIIITPPLIDLLLSFGKGYDMAYMYSIDNIVKSYFLFFGDWTGKGITPGIRTEVFFVLIFSFAYVFNKTKNWIKSALFCLSFYSLLFSYLAVPVFLQVIMSALNLPINLEYDFRINEISIYLYLILIFLTLLSIFKYYNQEYFMAIMKDARWLRAFYYIFMFVFGAIFAESSFSIFKGVDNVDSMISFLKFVVIMIAIFLAWIFSLMINNIVDQDIDKISNQARPLIKKTIALQDYYVISVIVGVLSLVYSLAVGTVILYSMVLFMGIYFIYSAPPFRLKRLVFISKLAVSINSLILFMLGWSAIKSLHDLPTTIIFYFLLLLTAMMNFIDIKDYAGDKANDIKTIPVLLGLRRGKLLVGFFFVLAYSWMPTAFSLPLKWTPLFLLLGLLQFIFVNKKQYNELPIFLTGFVSIIILIVNIIFK